MIEDLRIADGDVSAVVVNECVGPPFKLGPAAIVCDPLIQFASSQMFDRFRERVREQLQTPGA